MWLRAFQVLVIAWASALGLGAIYIFGFLLVNDIVNGNVQSAVFAGLALVVFSLAAVMFILLGILYPRAVRALMQLARRAPWTPRSGA